MIIVWSNGNDYVYGVGIASYSISGSSSPTPPLPPPPPPPPATTLGGNPSNGGRGTFTGIWRPREIPKTPETKLTRSQKRALKAKQEAKTPILKSLPEQLNIQNVANAENIAKEMAAMEEQHAQAIEKAGLDLLGLEAKQLALAKMHQQLAEQLTQDEITLILMIDDM